MKAITKSIWVLSFISLFTDIASEMLYPILPLYLKSIGFSVLLIGILEGFAEATAGLSKGYFGNLSDASGRRVPFVQWGYFLSALSKPMMALLTFPVWIFSARTLDRFGKGLRTGARDALLSDEATPETKGTVFGFHRSMDTLGAVIGPICAIIYLHFFPEDYSSLFYWAIIPGFIAVIISRFLKEKKKVSTSPTIKPTGFFSFLNYWKESPISYRRLSIALLIFALVNSSDVFLLMMVKSKGFTDLEVIAVYIFYNLIYAIASFPIGILSDKIGLRRILLLGLGLFSIVYFGMAFAEKKELFYLLFFIYGIYAASTEGITKALITNITSSNDSATAIGTFAGLNSLAALLASSFAGFLWYVFGAPTVFIVSSLVTILVLLYLTSVKIEDMKRKPQ
ncbi:transporter, major facilitator family protein [Leptospira broomii serovar Hurstbridge str. 5399]|uniref:Transporter, major facilitator family protein n=1 Tax=Leptospira broomii serovar Hurstbridge str. 5399 TaxID=1049789 RepID=T0FEG8_9LEPT|nr:MFS transporter [Leptospira broomii]EQA46281.1 transporter, major facilitator family protein [Leptospira broomii serovar Hurstbridge str. 5399]